MGHIDLSMLILAGIAAFLVGLAKGGLTPFGMVSVPVLALAISPVKAAALLLPIFIVSDMVGLWLYRKNYDRRNLSILVPAAIVGIAIGWATSSMIPQLGVSLLIGIIGVAFCVNNWRMRHHTVEPRKADVARGIFWGTIAGFVSFVSHSGGPPYQVYVLPQRLPKLTYAGTATITFAIINAVKLIPYWALGQLNSGNLQASAFLMPVAIGGTWAGVRLVRIIPERSFYRFAQVMLFIVSLKLIVDAVLALST